jgi:SAM-dependent methyltransferase
MPNDYSPVAEYYDDYVRSTIDLPFFLEECRTVDGKVLELMAGTGRISLPLVEAGVELTCVDFSAEMVSILRRKLAAQHRAAAVHLMDVRKLDLGESFDLAILPFNAFAELVTERDRSDFLAGVSGHLRHGGTFICTMHNPTVRLKTVDGAIRMIGRYDMKEKGHSLMVWLAEQFRGLSAVIDAVQILETYGAGNSMQDRRYMSMQYTFISHEEAESLFIQAGFTVHAVYGDYARAPFAKEKSPFMIWLLRR